MENDLAVEEINIDPFLLEQAFKKGLLNSRLIFLDELKHMAMRDSMLDKDRKLLEKAFQQMRVYVGQLGDKLRTIKLSDWRQFGLKTDVIDRIGYLSFELDSLSPKEKQKKLSKMAMLSRNNSVTEEYVDDFEEIDSEEEDFEELSDILIAPAPTKGLHSMQAGVRDSRDTTVPLSTPKLTVSSSVVVDSQKKTRRIPAWITNREWKLGDKIGAGSFGEVFQALNNRGKLVAVKRMNFKEKPSEMESLETEIATMSGLKHENIVEYLGYYISEDCCMYIFQEWVPGGSVQSLLSKFGPFSISIVRNYTRQVLCGLKYLHEKGIIHRDIKGGNILVDEGGTVKLADFGASGTLSAMDETQETSTLKGTPYFMAPEVVSTGKYGRKGDIWAVGCTFYQMLHGEPPWKSFNLRGIVQLHVLLSQWESGPPPVSPEVQAVLDAQPDAKIFMNLCFVKNDSKRPTAVELLKSKFLEEDSSHFEESFSGASFRGLSDLTGENGILRKQMVDAVSKSLSGKASIAASGSYGEGEGDTLDDIERRLARNRAMAAEHGAGAVAGGSGNRNPYGQQRLSSRERERAMSDEPVKSSGQAYDLARLSAQLPASDRNGFCSSEKPATPRDLLFTPRGSSYGGSSGGEPDTPLPSSSSLQPPRPSKEVLTGSGAAGSGSGSGYSSAAGSASASVGAGLSSNNPYAKGASRSSFAAPPPLDRRERELVQDGPDLRNSLQNIKQKAKQKEAWQRDASANGSAGTNMSSNRDSEQLTPLYADEDLDLRPRSGQNKFDTRYFEEKHLPAVAGCDEELTEDEEEYEGHEIDSDSAAKPGSRQQQQRHRQQGFVRQSSIESVEEILNSDNERNSSDIEDDEPPSPLKSLPPVQSAAYSGIRKSSSQPHSIGVPKLTGIERSAHDSNSSGLTATGKHVSQSARYHRPEPAGVAVAHRPYTSKAALGHRDPPAAAASAKVSASSSKPPTPHNASSALPSDTSPWRCLKCSKVNRHPKHCENCATLKGATGKRDTNATISRF